MNVAARIGMEIHAVQLSALFLEVIKSRNLKCPLCQYFPTKQFEISIITFSLYLKLVGMKLPDAKVLAQRAITIRSAAAGLVTPIIVLVRVRMDHVLANERNWQQMPHR